MTLGALADHIFGPYYLYSLFKDDWTGSNSATTLDSVQFFCGTEPVGLDDIEYLGAAPPGSYGATNSITFTGVLVLEKLDWLSERGRRWLERDLSARDHRIHLAHQALKIDLNRLYARDFKLRVRITCDKSMAVSYATAQKELDGMIVYAAVMQGSQGSQSQPRFRIQSLFMHTLQQSRNFIARYRLRALLQNLVETDNTPLEERNINWLISRYCAGMEKKEKDNIRPVPQHPRHVPQAEIYNLFASHAEWLLAHMLLSLASQSLRLLDIPQWVGWCERVRTASLKASEHGVRVSWSQEYGSSRDLATRLAQYGSDKEFWQNQLNHVKSKKKSKSAPTAMAAQSTGMASRLSPPPGSVEFNYDEDFSSSSSSSNQEESESVDIPIPSFLQQLPSLPNSNFEWFCPSETCGFYLNLLDPDIALQEHLSPQQQAHLLSKNWCLLDNDIQRSFLTLVDQHYRDHLKDLGLHVDGTGQEGPKVTQILSHEPGQIKVEEKQDTDLIPHKSNRVSKVPRKYVSG